MRLVDLRNELKEDYKDVVIFMKMVIFIEYLMMIVIL